MPGGGELKHEDFFFGQPPHSIYLYLPEKEKWVRKERLELREGINVIYFDNTQCPACRVYDVEWFPLVTLMGRENSLTFWIALCRWFAGDCDDEGAKEAFEKYDVHVSPTTMIIAVKDGKVLKEKRLEGVVRVGKLKEAIKKMMSEVNGPG